MKKKNRTDVDSRRPLSSTELWPAGLPNGQEKTKGVRSREPMLHHKPVSGVFSVAVDVPCAALEFP